MKAVTAEMMTEIDKRAQEEFGIPQDLLMENAGRAVAETILEDDVVITEQSIAVLCGKGNNGGDGYVAARYLHNHTPKSLVIFTQREKEIRGGAALRNFEAAAKMGIEMLSNEMFKPDDFTIVVDAVFGTGFRGELSDEVAKISELVNNSEAKVYAVDIPSGLNATTGAAARGSFKANVTISFGLPKKGFYEKEGPCLCGDVIVKNIGFPCELLEQYQ